MDYKVDKVYKKNNWRRVSECIHSHSFFCNHAVNSPREMVEKAYKEKYTIFGLSEHCPFESKEDGSVFHHMRPTTVKYEDLLEEMNLLKKEYEGKMIILNGVEAEYYYDKKDYLLSLIKNDKADYIILGNHSSDYGIYYSKQLDKEDILDIYVKTAKEAMETGLFLYMAHPDFILKYYFIKWGEMQEKVAHGIFSHAKKFNYAVGFNINGMRFTRTNNDGNERMIYPIKEFWMIAKEYGVKILIEQDAHNREMLDQVYWDRAVSLIEDWGLANQVVSIKDLEMKKYVMNIKRMTYEHKT